jgi:hypothetical protein
MNHGHLLHGLSEYYRKFRHSSATCLLTVTQTLPLSSLLISHVAYTPSLPVLI